MIFYCYDAFSLNAVSRLQERFGRICERIFKDFSNMIFNIFILDLTLTNKSIILLKTFSMIKFRFA